MAVRAIRGAVQVDANERDLVLEATEELVAEVMRRNELGTDDFISVLFTATQDLNAEFPALAARKLGFTDVPLMCSTEIAVPHALPRVVRLMAHVETERPRDDIQRLNVPSMTVPRSLNSAIISVISALSTSMLGATAAATAE